MSIGKWVTKIEIGNFLVALSTTGLMALGVIPMSIMLLVILALIFLVIGVIGRYVDGVKDDTERLRKYEEYLNGGNTPTEDSTGVVSNSTRDERVQRKDIGT